MSSSSSEFHKVLAVDHLDFKSSHDPTHNLRIEFAFSPRIACSGWHVSPTNPAFRLIGFHNYVLPRTSIAVHLNCHAEYGRAAGPAIEGRLTQYPVWNDADGPRWRRTLVRYALIVTRIIASRWMPRRHNAIRVELGVSFHYGNFYFEEGAPSRSDAIAVRRGLMVPAAPSAVESLRRKRVSSALDCESCCAICLDGYGEAEEVVLMPCSHYFHGVCIEKWLSRSHYCPSCRFEMPMEGNSSSRLQLQSNS